MARPARLTAGPASQHDSVHAPQVTFDCNSERACARPLFRTGQPGQGWATGVWGVEANDGSGAFVDLRGPSFVIGADDVFNWDVLDDEHADPCIRTRVYNLEVDEFHTYYVGELGVWVGGENLR